MPYTYCPYCAARLVPREHDGRTLPSCPDCSFVFYNNSAPCVGVLVVRDGAVLLVKRAFEPFQGYWDIPGGFLESGEPPAEGARRELLEETGLEIAPTEMIGFYMDVYGEEQEPTLNICYLATVIGGEERAGSDATETAWFPLEALPEQIAFTWEREALEAVRLAAGQ